MRLCASRCGLSFWRHKPSRPSTNIQTKPPANIHHRNTHSQHAQLTRNITSTSIPHDLVAIKCPRRTPNRTTRPSPPTKTSRPFLLLPLQKRRPKYHYKAREIQWRASHKRRSRRSPTTSSSKVRGPTASRSRTVLTRPGSHRASSQAQGAVRIAGSGPPYASRNARQ